MVFGCHILNEGLLVCNIFIWCVHIFSLLQCLKHILLYVHFLDDTYNVKNDIRSIVSHIHTTSQDVNIYTYIIYIYIYIRFTIYIYTRHKTYFRHIIICYI